MKISSFQDPTAKMIEQYSRSEALPQGTAKKSSEAVRNEEQVNLSPQARELQQIRGIVASQPEVRTEKVQELKSRIADGSYEVRAEKIAEEMVRESLLDIFA